MTAGFCPECHSAFISPHGTPEKHARMHEETRRQGIKANKLAMHHHKKHAEKRVR